VFVVKALASEAVDLLGGAGRVGQHRVGVRVEEVELVEIHAGDALHLLRGFLGGGGVVGERDGDRPHLAVPRVLGGEVRGVPRNAVRPKLHRVLLGAEDADLLAPGHAGAVLDGRDEPRLGQRRHRCGAHVADVLADVGARREGAADGPVEDESEVVDARLDLRAENGELEPVLDGVVHRVERVLVLHRL
jgi:hypothetical protein